MNPQDPTATKLSFLDSDSCLSVSPSPGIESEEKSFDFGEPSGNLNAALQTEKEFLNFILSLPRSPKKESLAEDESHTSIEDIKVKVSPKPSSAAIISNASHVGLDHLDNLCKMMEQLKELRQQNTRLQHRVEYLEDLKNLQDMSRDMDGSLCAESRKLRQSPLGLSDSDLRLQEIQGSRIFTLDSEESINLGSCTQADFLDMGDMECPPGVGPQSSEEDQPPSLPADLQRRSIKGKKGSKSAWGKVKNIIAKKDGSRKQSLPVQTRSPNLPNQSLTHSMSTSCAKYNNDPFSQSSNCAASDPEDYHLEDPSEPHWNTDADMEAGIWIGRKISSREETGGANSSSFSKRKPQLTITVPSNEDLTTHKLSLPKSSERSDTSSSPKNLEPRRSTSITPPSPRRTSNWYKVKQAFLTNHHHSKQTSSKGFAGSPSVSPMSSSSPHNKGVIAGKYDTSAPFDDPSTGTEPSTGRDPFPKNIAVSPQHDPQNSLVELQKKLTGEFSKKIHEWEKLKKIPGSHDPRPRLNEELPPEFRKKLHDWQKRKRPTKVKNQTQLSTGSNTNHIPPQSDLKTRNYAEEELPPDFKKKFTEWQLRMALAGKGPQNVEAIQKNLGEEFNRKLAEWEKIKVHSNFAIDRRTPHRRSTPRRSANARASPLLVAVRQTDLEKSTPSNVLEPSVGYELRRTAKSKKAKTNKSQMVKPHTETKSRAKELQWLNKELSKIERQKQRLEREKEKFVEREARLEKMKHAMRDTEPEKKDVCIKTSTGEFRFEGISQTFTKKLYEWEERRGIRPESSTFILLDPNYKAPADNVSTDFRHKTPEPRNITRSLSHGSLGERVPKTLVSCSHTATSLNNINREQSPFQEKQRTSSEPILKSEPSQHDLAVIRADEELMDDLRKSSLELIRQAVIESHLASMPNEPPPPEKPESLDHFISSKNGRSVSCQNLTSTGEGASYLQRRESTKSEEDYRNLIHENMALLGRLKEKEHVCRQLETQMGHIDNKMDNVADQHFKTMERLHRHVNHMRKSESFGRKSKGSFYMGQESETEKTRLFIEQLKSRIVELEEKGNKLMGEKEELEVSLKMHKKQETMIAESLLLRIRELQDAGAEVNIQTVKCGKEELDRLRESHESSSENICEDDPKGSKKMKRRELSSKERNESAVIRRRHLKRNTPSRKRCKPRRLQKLDHLTSNLLFQAKQLEQALIYKHNLSDGSPDRKEKQSLFRKRSLRSEKSFKAQERRPKERRGKEITEPRVGRTWSSIEDIFQQGSSHKWAQAMAIESQDLLHMNSELTKMAKELRSEMTNLWNPRESTSDSNSSMSRTELIENLSESKFCEIEQGKTLEEEELWLTQQAREVFHSIASLQEIATKSSSEENIIHKALPFSLGSSSDNSNHDNQYSMTWQQPDHRSYCSAYSEPSTSDENKGTSACPRKNKKRRNRCSHSNNLNLERDDRVNSHESLQEVSWNASFFGSSTPLEDLVRADQQKMEYRRFKQRRGNTERSSSSYDEADVSDTSTSSDNDTTTVPTNKVPLNTKSDGLLEVRGDSFRSNAPSTLRSAILSSSFEYEENNLDNRREDKNKPTDQDNLTEQGKHSRPSEDINEAVTSMSPYETSVNHVHAIHQQKGLHMRRLSDTQIEYDESMEDSRTENSPIAAISPNRNAGAVANSHLRVRRNQSESDIGRNSGIIEEDSDSEAGGIFVETRRTIFSLCNDDPSSNFRVTNNQNRLKKLKWDFEHSQVVPLEARVSSLYENRLNKTLSKNHSDGRFSDEFELCGQTPESFEHSISPTGDERIEANAKNEEQEKEFSSVKDMVEMYNDRITRNQKLLINPFTMDEVFKSGKISFGTPSRVDRMHTVSKSRSISAMVVRPPVPSVPRCSSSSQVPQMGLSQLNRRKLGIRHPPTDQCSPTERQGFVDDRIVSVCFGDEDNDGKYQLPARATRIKKAKEEFFNRDLDKAKGAMHKTPAEQCEEPSSSILDDSMSYLDQSYDLTDNFSEECLLDRSLSEPHEAPPKPPRSAPYSLHPPVMRQESFRRRSEGASPSQQTSKEAYEQGAQRSISSSHVERALQKSPSEKKLSLGFLKFFKRNKTKPKESQTIEKLCRQSLIVDIDCTKVRPVSTSSCKANNVILQGAPGPSTTETHSFRTLPRESGLGVPIQNVHSCPSSPVTRPKSRTAQLLEKSKQLFKTKSAPSQK